MPTTLNPNSSPSVPASISVPNNGENANAASIRPAFQGLLDGLTALDTAVTSLTDSWRILHFDTVSSAVFSTSIGTTSSAANIFALPSGLPSGCVALVSATLRLQLAEETSRKLHAGIYRDAVLLNNGTLDESTSTDAGDFRTFAITLSAGLGASDNIHLTSNIAIYLKSSAAVTLASTPLVTGYFVIAKDYS